MAYGQKASSCDPLMHMTEQMTWCEHHMTTMSNHIDILKIATWLHITWHCITKQQVHLIHTGNHVNNVHMNIMWSSYGYHMSIVSPHEHSINGHHADTMWLSHTYHVNILWAPCVHNVISINYACGHHMDTHLISYGHHVIIIWTPMLFHMDTMWS